MSFLLQVKRRIHKTLLLCLISSLRERIYPEATLTISKEKELYEFVAKTN